MPTPANLNQPYDPSSVQPYQAPEIPEPDMTAATTSTPGSDPSSPGKSSKGYDFTRPGAGNITHGGAIAGMADNLLRGFMDGRAKGEAMKAMKMKRETDNIRANVDLASKNFYNVAASGADQNSKEFKDAKAASDGAWNSWTTYIQGHITPPDAGKKGKGAKVKEGLAGMFGKGDDPAQVSQGYYQVAVKMGNPVNHQVAALYGPQAQLTRQTAANNLTAANPQSQNAIAKAAEEKQDMQDRVTLRTMESTRDASKNDPNVSWTAKNRDDLYALQDKINDKNKPPTTKEVLARKIDRFYQLPKEEQEKPEQQNYLRSLKAENEELNSRGTEPKTPFEAEVAAEKKAKGRDLTTDEIDRIDSRIEMRKKIHAAGGSGDGLTERQNKDRNAIRKDTTTAMDNIDKKTDTKMSNLNKDAENPKNGFELYSPEWKRRAATIEKSEYQAKIAHGKEFAANMRQLGEKNVEVPMPEPWSTSYLKEVDPTAYKKIFPEKESSGEQETAPVAPKKEEKTQSPSSAKGEAKLQPGQPLVWNGNKTSVQEVRHNNQGKYAYKIDNQWYTDDELKLK